MKSVFLAVLAVLAVMVVADDDFHPCVDDHDCKLDECCVLDLAGRGSVCREYGDDVGDLCGGKYFCSVCEKGLTCNPTKLPEQDPYGCNHPANGTCQRIRPLLDRPQL